MNKVARGRRRDAAFALVPDDDLPALDDDFEESSDDSFPTSPVGDAGGDAPGGDRSLVLRDVDSSDSSDSDPRAGSSGSSALDSSD